MRAIQTAIQTAIQNDYFKTPLMKVQPNCMNIHWVVLDPDYAVGRRSGFL